MCDGSKCVRDWSSVWCRVGAREEVWSDWVHGEWGGI